VTAGHIQRIGQERAVQAGAFVVAGGAAAGRALTRPINWDVVETNYDQMIKYATAIRQGTASTEAILRRFTRSASHPTYTAMLEVGRALTATRRDYDANVRAFLAKPAPRAISSCQSA